MKFFKPEDFEPLMGNCKMMADKANAKLEREGKVVYGQEHESGAHLSFKKRNNHFSDTYTALLINIEPIEKCKHPAEKIGIYYADINDRLKDFVPNYKCECGAKVRPKEFVESEE